MFHDIRATSADRGSTHILVTTASRLSSGAWAFSSHGADATEPLTPLSRSATSLASPSLSRGLHLHRTVGFWPWYAGRRLGRSAEITRECFA